MRALRGAKGEPVNSNEEAPAVVELPEDEFLSGLRSDEAIKGTPHRMVPGSHERSRGAECVCGGAWDHWSEQCVNQKGASR